MTATILDPDKARTGAARTGRDHYRDEIEILSYWVRCWQRILREHKPVGTRGRLLCGHPSCGQPGYGTPYLPYPCGVKMAAMNAQEVYMARTGLLAPTVGGAA